MSLLPTLNSIRALWGFIGSVFIEKNWWEGFELSGEFGFGGITFIVCSHCLVITDRPQYCERWRSSCVQMETETASGEWVECCRQPYAARMLSCFSHVQLFVTLWTVAHQTPLSMGSVRQGYWSGLPWPLPAYVPSPGTEPVSLASSASAGRFFTTSATVSLRGSWWWLKDGWRGREAQTAVVKTEPGLVCLSVGWSDNLSVCPQFQFIIKN